MIRRLASGPIGVTATNSSKPRSTTRAESNDRLILIAGPVDTCNSASTSSVVSSGNGIPRPGVYLK